LQQSIPLLQRRKVFVAVDEFQNFSGGDFDKLLSEDTKYGCAMLLATQNLKRLNYIRDGLLEIVLSNCQQLGVFRISAADAKMMEEELQKKVTVKHIISQPGLHCYARLALQGYPLQIVSVQLVPPASWKDDLVRDRQAEKIRRTSQQHNLPSDEVDRRYAVHLRQFLNVKAYANRLQNEARAARTKKQERDKADQLAQDLQAAQIITGTTQSEASTPAELPPSGDAMVTSHRPQEQETASTSLSKTKPARNHRRSRRMGKQSGDALFPARTTAQVDDVKEENNTLPGSGGTPAQGGSSWGTQWGYEGREGRERV
jgi:hypothetical protein